MAVTGRVVILLLGGLIAVAVSPSMVTVRLWWLVVVLLVALDVALAVSPKRLSWQRLPSTPVRLHQDATSVLSVHNTANRTVRGVLRDAWQPSAGAVRERHPLRLSAGQRAELTTRLIPTRRGRRDTDQVTVRSLGPLGLAGRQRSIPVPGTLTVLPPFPSRRHLPRLLAVLRQLDGRSAVRVRGQGTEFDSLRDYVSGDDVRSIDWRATARRGAVVVRTWRPERDRHIVIVVDTSRTSAGRVQDTPRLDAALDAALLLATVATRAGDRVDVIVGDRQVRTRVLSAGRGDRLDRLSSALSDAHPALVEADWSVLGAEVSRRAPRRALVVLLTPLEPAAVEEALIPVLEGMTRRHRVIVASVRDPALSAMTHTLDTIPQVHAAAAAEQTLRRRERTSAVIQRMGATVIDAPPDQLPLALSSAYLKLKGRGAL